MKTGDTAQTIDELLSRGVGTLVDPDGMFKKKLSENPHGVVIKLGVDPTRPDIHLGHAVALRALRQFQNIGCKVVFLIGDLTAQIGDPSGKSSVRPEVSRAEIEKNMKTYLDQVGKILLTDPAVFSWIRNSDWFVSMNDVDTEPNTTVSIDLGKEKITLPPLPKNHFLAKAFVWDTTRMQKGNITTYSFLNVLATLRKVTYARLIERDMFQERINAGKELYMHEMLYPVLQGIDSNAIAQIYGSCDLEVGGTDQTFNMLMGRDIMKINERAPQAVLSFELLEGLDGKEKMSKSLDNYIAITDEPSDMYGKVMSLPDSLMTKYFRLCTYTPLADIEDIEKTLAKGKENPRDIKMRLAREIVEIYHGKEKAERAEEAFVNTFSKGGIPETIPTVTVKNGASLQDIVRENSLVTSNSEFRRLVESGAVERMDTSSTVGASDITVKENGTYRIGKNRFLKIVVE